MAERSVHIGKVAGSIPASPIISFLIFFVSAISWYIIVMNIVTQNLVSQYVAWYLIEVPAEILKGWKNFLVFNLNFFSVPNLLMSYFAPWRRYSVSYGRGFDVMVYLEAFFSNMIFRIIGAIVRTVLIFMGVVSEIFFLIAGLLVLLVWLALPVLLLGGFLLGLNLLI